jgi:hypothetical protein
MGLAEASVTVEVEDWLGDRPQAFGEFASQSIRRADCPAPKKVSAPRFRSVRVADGEVETVSESGTAAKPESDRSETRIIAKRFE